MLETRYQIESIKGKKFYPGSWFQEDGEGIAEGLSGKGKGMQWLQDSQTGSRRRTTLRSGCNLQRAPSGPGIMYQKVPQHPKTEPPLETRHSSKEDAERTEPFLGEKYMLFIKTDT